MNNALASVDWRSVLGSEADSAAKRFTDKLLSLAKRFIPYGLRFLHKEAHPWLNMRCRAAVAKNFVRAQITMFTKLKGVIL